MKPVFVGKEQIMAYYDNVNPDGLLAYSVWFGDRCMLQCPGEVNEDKARDLLALSVESWDKTGFDKTLWLRLHPSTNNPIDRKTPVLMAQPIGFGEGLDEDSVSGISGMVIRGNNGMNLEMYKAIAGLDNLPKTIGDAIDARLKDYEERLTRVEQPTREEPTITAQIGSFVQANPHVVSDVLNFLRSFIPSVPQTLQPAAPMAINGAPQAMAEQPTQETPQQPKEIDNDKLNLALDRLEPKMILDDDLTLLADFADKEPEQFNWLLTMLRKK